MVIIIIIIILILILILILIPPDMTYLYTSTSIFLCFSAHHPFSPSFTTITPSSPPSPSNTKWRPTTGRHQVTASRFRPRGMQSETRHDTPTRRFPGSKIPTWRFVKPLEAFRKRKNKRIYTENRPKPKRKTVLYSKHQFSGATIC